MKKNRHTIILYTTAVCNLNCNYCFIDKNPALKDIDNLLDDSFNGDYYFNLAKKAFENKEQLKEVQFWGGEPFLRMDRVHYTIRKFIEYFPNFSSLMSSTNFVSENFLSQFFNLLNVLGEYPDRQFTFNLQLSLDGPKEINDISRGIGVTDKFLNRFDEFLEEVENNKIPKNVIVKAHFKPTLDNNTFKTLLYKEKIINYFLFFDNLISKAKNKENENFYFVASKPNFAVPSPHTQKDGKLFAYFTDLLIQISKENKTKHYFKNYDNIVLFIPKNYQYLVSLKNGDILPTQTPGYTCDSGCGMVGLLPNNKISECHLSFTELLEEYKNYANLNKGGKNSSLDFNFFFKNSHSQTNIPFEQLDLYENKVQRFWEEKTTFRIGTLMNQIQLLAYVGQISPKYKDVQESLKAAHFIQNATVNCIRDNIGITGSMYLRPIGDIKLFLNGAADLIENFIIEEFIND